MPIYHKQGVGDIQHVLSSLFILQKTEQNCSMSWLHVSGLILEDSIRLYRTHFDYFTAQITFSLIDTVVLSVFGQIDGT